MIFRKPKKHQEFPDFWKIYQILFEKKSKSGSIRETRCIAFDTETTGFDYQKDRVLSIGSVAIRDGAVNVADQLEVYLQQDRFNAETVHIHGIIKNTPFKTFPELEALHLFIDYIGDAVLIAHHAEFDRRMIDTALQRHGLGKLKNRFLDTEVLFRKTKHSVYLSGIKDRRYSLDEVCNDLKISMSDRHTASGDAFITAIAFLKVISKLKISKDTHIKKLF